LAGRSLLSTGLGEETTVRPNEGKDREGRKEEIGKEIEGGDQEGEDGHAARYRKLGPEPTQEEIDEHNMDHGTFRSWCPHCVKGAAMAYPHRKSQDKSREEVPVVSIDYMFMNEKQNAEEEKGMPILVMKDRKTKMIWAHVVAKKGRDGYAIKRISKNISLLGHRKIIFKSDGEPSIVALKEAVKAEQAIDMILEESPVGDHRANGEVEAAVKQVQAKIRTQKDALETRIGERMKGDHQILPWLVSHAAATINRRRKDEEGFTAHRRWKGKEFNRKVAEFGEAVQYLRLGSEGRDKMGSRWGRGIWMGIREETGESIIGTEEGTVKCKDFRREEIGSRRWDKDMLGKVQGVPWQTVPGREGDDIKVRIIMKEDKEEITEGVIGRKEETMPRRVKIYKEDLKKYGYTIGCDGCKAASRGKVHQGHSEECRKRIER